MKVAIIAGDAPAELIRMMPALTDAGRAVPGLELTVFGAPVVAALARRHELVRRAVEVPFDSLAVRWWNRAARGRRRRFFASLEGRDQPFDRLIDPIGSAATADLARLLSASRRCGLGRDQLTDARLARHYDEHYPLPDHLHPVQRHRVLMAAVLDYGIHDLKPDYGVAPANPELARTGTGVVVSLDAAAVGWSEPEVEQVVTRLEEQGVDVSRLPAEAPEPSDETAWWSQVEQAGYVIAGNNATAHLAAALGRPGLTLCPEGQAATCSAISNRYARRAMVGIDQSRLVRPEVVAEATLRTLERMHEQDEVAFG
ncbi:MAG: hypothetical protein ACLFQH_03600 [Halothiobacillaceae bacterium]